MIKQLIGCFSAMTKVKRSITGTEDWDTLNKGLIQIYDSMWQLNHLSWEGKGNESPDYEWQGILFNKNKRISKEFPLISDPLGFTNQH